MQPMENIQSGLNIPFCHVVRVDIVVYMFMPFIGTNHIVDFILVPFSIIFCSVGPELRRIEQNLRAVVPHELVIGCNMPVLPDSICDTGGDMQFNMTVQNRDEFTTFRMNNGYRRGFLSIECTLPRVLRTQIAVMLSLGSCSWQEMITVKQQIARNFWHFIDEERQHEDFGVVENVTTVAKSGQPFRRNTIPAVM